MVTNTAADMKEFAEFPTKLPEEVLERYPELELWQAENWIAWRDWLEILGSPIFNRIGVIFRKSAFREVRQPLPRFPAPLPERLIKRFPDLRDWQVDNAKMWDRICQRLGFRRNGEKEYGENTSDAYDKTLENTYNLRLKQERQWRL